jgi:hypothetical protein
VKCCDQCDRILSATYLLCGDGDGVEFLVEVALLRSGETAETTVRFSVFD